MTTPNSPLSPSSHSSFDDDDDDAPYDTKPASSDLTSHTNSPDMPPLQKPSTDDTQLTSASSATSSLSSSRRHSLSSSSLSSASPHLLTHSLADTSLSSSASTTPSSAMSSNPTSPFVPTHSSHTTHPLSSQQSSVPSLAHLTVAAGVTPHNGKAAVKAEESEKQHSTAALTQMMPSAALTGNSNTGSGSSPSHTVASLGSLGGMSASEAAVIANSATLHRAMMAGHTALVQQQQQQQHQHQHSLASLASAGHSASSALTALSNTLSSLQYSNRPTLPAPLASLPPLALSFSSHTSGNTLTPSAAAAAAAANSGAGGTLSQFASSLHSNLFKGAAANAGIMSQLMQHANSGGGSSAPLSPLPAATALTNSGMTQQANGINWSLTLPVAAAPQPASSQLGFTTPPQSASPSTTPPTFPSSSSATSLASLSALALPAANAQPADVNMSASNNTLTPPSPFTSGAPTPPPGPMLPMPSLGGGVPSSTLSPYAYSSSSPSSTSLSALTQQRTFSRLPSLPLSLPSPTLQSLYPSATLHSHLSSASFAPGTSSGGITSSSPLSLSSIGGMAGSMATPLSWPASVSSSSAVSTGAPSQLNRYLIHFPADTAHGAQSGLYQPGKPSQLIIHMAAADADLSATPTQQSTAGVSAAGVGAAAVPSVSTSASASAGGSASEAEVLRAGHSMIRIPVKVAIKPTVKRTAKLRQVHEVSVNPAWYDCDSRDLSEEEKRWETGSKSKKPKYLLLRHDTKKSIHVVAVNKWTADEQTNNTAGGDDATNTTAPRDGMTAANSNTSAALSGLLHSLTAAGGSLPFVPQSAPTGSSSSSAAGGSATPLPLHILPVTDDSMAHVQTKGRGKTEERRKETAQLYLSLKVDKWYELRCHYGWRILAMEMKHHKGGHQISSVVIPFHYLPGDLTVGEGVQAITLLAAGSHPTPVNAASGGSGASGTAAAPTTGKKGRAAAVKMDVDNVEESGGGGGGSRKSRGRGNDESSGTDRKGSKSSGVKTESDGAEKSNGGRSSNKRKQPRDSKQSAAAAAAAVAVAAEQDKQHQQQQQHQANIEARSIQQRNLQHLALVNSMVPFTPSGPATIYMHHPASFSQLSPSSPSTASYPQLPNGPSSLPLSISAFDPSILLHQPGTPNTSLMSPNTAHMLSGQLSPGTLFANITNEQYAMMVRRGGVGAGNASPGGGGEGLNFFISTNSAFKTRSGSKGGNTDKADEDNNSAGEGSGGGSGQKRRKIGSGGSSSSGGGEGAEGEDGSKQDDEGSTLSGGSAGDDILNAPSGSASSSLPQSGGLSGGKPPRDVSAIDLSGFDSSFLLRSESSASTFSLPGTTISLHPFTSSAGNHSLLLPPPPTSYNSSALAAAAAAAVAASSAVGGSGGGSGASKAHHPPPSIKIPTASRLSPSLSPLLSQSLGMTLSPSPSLVPLGSASNYFHTLSPPPSTPTMSNINMMESEGLFAAVSAAGSMEGQQARRTV